MTTKQLEIAIENQYDNGRYLPTGADGGVLRYITVNINGQYYNASITLDHELAEIRRIWQLSEVDKDGKKQNVVFDFTRQYYDARAVA